MNHILLISKDMEYCKKLLKHINSEDNLKVTAIASNIEEIRCSLLNCKIDIIIMILNISEYNYIRNEKIISNDKYIDSALLILDDNNVNKFINNDTICDCIVKSNDINNIIDIINKIIFFKENKKLHNMGKIQEKNIKNNIKKELEYLGYSYSYSGTTYIAETIYILTILRNYRNDNLEKDIYPLVGKKFNKSAHNIKCNIRNATDMMTYECEEKKLKEYLWDYEFLKPGPKRIIYAILGKINNK